MRTRATFALVAALAAFTAALTAGSVSARNLSFNTKTFRITWELLDFYGEDGETKNLEARCPVTLEGSFHSATMRKTVWALVGNITRAVAKEESCVGAFEARAAFFPTSLPWHMTYLWFTGTLPEIRTVRMRVAAIQFRISAGGIDCTYRESGTGIGQGDFFREPGSLVLGFAFDPTWGLPSTTLEFFCQVPSLIGVLEGTGTVRKLGTTEHVGIRLI